MGSDELEPGERKSRATSPIAFGSPGPTPSHPNPIPASPGFTLAVAWLCVALWVGVILSLGSDPFSSDGTSRFLGPMLRWLLPDVRPELLGEIQFAIRKSAHVVEYGVLALLSVRAWRLTSRRSQWSNALAAVAVVVAVAATDEWRQAQSIDRQGAASDVILDTAGGVSALLGGRLASRWLARWR